MQQSFLNINFVFDESFSWAIPTVRVSIPNVSIPNS